MRFTEIKNDEYTLETCDICYKTDVDFVRELGHLETWWNDVDDCITVCGECKKKEEVKPPVSLTTLCDCW
ncbi:MAG: hypothetical protein NUV76_12365 [Candidatus Kuenenia sp.]|nr:hypothetical protein [Candidatus Kuenenia sp.]